MKRITAGLLMTLAAVLAVAGAAAGGPALPAGLALQPVASVPGRVVAVRHAGDGSGRLFLVRQRGTIVVYDGGAVDVQRPFLDISARVLFVAGYDERGLLGLAFHPDYASNGRFFVNYTDADGATVVAEYRVGDDPDLADVTERRLLRVAQDFANHNGGDMHFGADGYLYIGIGDGGSGGDPNRRAQDLGSLLGKLLRIDVDAAPGGANTLCGEIGGYAIPPDNPFATAGDGPIYGDGFETAPAAAAAASGGGAAGGGCPEIWAYGLRNPWRFSFDRASGDLLVGDVGQQTAEEVSLLPAGQGGLNLGWRCFEGPRAYASAANDPVCQALDAAQTLTPIISYGRPVGLSVTGGYRYRGSLAALAGLYVYGDFVTGRIWFAAPDGGDWNSSEWRDTDYQISTFGEDEAGELYLADYDSREAGVSVYRFVINE